jgi:PAS domain S-box-containing protein
LLSIRSELEKESILKVLLSSFDDGVWLWNLEAGQFDAIGPSAQALFSAALNLFNQDPEKWIYQVHADDREMVLEACTFTLFNKGQMDIQYRLVYDQGGVRWLWDRRKIITNTEGQAIYVHGIAQDITKRKNYERRLEDTELSYKVMFLQHPNPMWVVSCKDGMIVEANEAAVAYYGYSVQEFQELPFSKLLAKGNQPKAIPLKRSEQQTAANHVDKHGNIINVLLTAADFAYQNQPTKLIMAIDITREIVDEQIIQELHKRLSDFKYALTSSAIVSISDKNGSIIYVNDNFLKISGYQRAELIGAQHNIVKSGYHPDAFFKDMWRCIAKGKIWRGEIRNKSKNGEYYWVDTYIVPLLDEKGKPYQYISIRSNITDRKQTEEELAELNRQLEERVKKRTQALELANNSLQDFAYSISHDLRAPVRHIRNFAQIVLDETSDAMSEDARKYQGYVIQATDRLSQQIEGLLEFSRVGSKLINYRCVDTMRMVHNIITQAKQQHPRQVCQFEVDDLPDVNADDVLLEQVFTNLVSNALKYSSKEKESRIKIGYKPIDGHHQFLVKDNGVGFDMAYAPKLFGMFSRLHSQSEFEGNGIGLVNVKRIVERHEGKVWAESALVKGATFYFTLSKQLKNEPKN